MGAAEMRVPSQLKGGGLIGRARSWGSDEVGCVAIVVSRLFLDKRRDELQILGQARLRRSLRLCARVTSSEAATPVRIPADNVNQEHR